MLAAKLPILDSLICGCFSICEVLQSWWTSHSSTNGLIIIIVSAVLHSSEPIYSSVFSALPAHCRCCLCVWLQ